MISTMCNVFECIYCQGIYFCNTITVTDHFLWERKFGSMYHTARSYGPILGKVNSIQHVCYKPWPIMKMTHFLFFNLYQWFSVRYDIHSCPMIQNGVQSLGGLKFSFYNQCLQSLLLFFYILLSCKLKFVYRYKHWWCICSMILYST